MKDFTSFTLKKFPTEDLAFHCEKAPFYKFKEEKKRN